MIRRLLCLFGFHGEPIGACDVVDYEFGNQFKSRRLRYRTYWICSVCRREVAGK